MSKWRISLWVPKGTPGHMVKVAIDGQIIEADGMRLHESGALEFFNLRGLWKEGALGPGDAQQFVEEPVIIVAPKVWRTVTPVVGATDQPTESSNENPQRQRQKE